MMTYASTARLLQVAWLGCWALLLGFRDYQIREQLLAGLPCLRPSEEEMLGLFELWARIAAAAEVGWGGMGKGWGGVGKGKLGPGTAGPARAVCPTSG